MHPSFELFNPFRSPTWRFERALRLVESDKKRCSRQDDQFVRAYFRFLRKWSASDDAEDRNLLFLECPGLYYAHTIYEQNNLTFNSLLQARLLSDLSMEEVADASCMIEDAVYWYEALFFNLRDRLRHRDYIVRTMMGNPAAAGDDHFIVDMTLKFYAYFAGSLVLDFLISGFDPGMEKPSEQRQVLEYGVANIHAKVTQRSMVGISTVDINQYNITELLNVHARLLEVKRMSESSGMREQDYMQNIGVVLQECQFHMRGRPNQLPDGRLPLGYNNTTGELRAHELIAMAHGEPGPSLAELNLPFPEARKPTDENAEQSS